MGWFSKLLGFGDAAKVVPDTVNAVGTTLDNLFTSDDERLTHAEIMARIQQEPGRLQALINIAEAQHRTVFVAGWRPFIGWVCGVSLAYTYIVRDIVMWALQVWAPHLPPLPLPQTQDIILELIMALLGLGTMRMIEKVKGVSK